MKETIGTTETEIKQLVNQIQEGTESTILSDKIAFIRDLLNEKLETIDFKMYEMGDLVRSTLASRRKKIIK